MLVAAASGKASWDGYRLDKVPTTSRKQPKTGTSHCVKSAKRIGGVAARGGTPKIRCRNSGEGWRGVHLRKSLSREFQSLITFSFQTVPQLLQSVTVPSRHCVRRNLEQRGDLFESMFGPDL